MGLIKIDEECKKPVSICYICTQLNVKQIKDKHAEIGPISDKACKDRVYMSVIEYFFSRATFPVKGVYVKNNIHACRLDVIWYLPH